MDRSATDATAPDMPDPRHHNHLAGESSPYLRQHAHQPVAWYPWGEMALARARAEDRPILLSIGYSACHWCHVMAHESFDDPATAELMNRLFINIKVDREERPDLDKIYQLAHQLLTRRGGGWPLTVFLTPHNLTPFFAGTYFPKVSRYGLPGFAELCRRVGDYYRDHRDEIMRINHELIEAMNSLEYPDSGGSQPDATPIDMARQQLGHSFDRVHGGFGEAPKFPHPPNLLRLLRYWAASRLAGHEDRPAATMIELTLTRMADGGIHDHLGGGFCRYAVDREWMIPHFEKMLYDNALLLPLYAQWWQVQGDPRMRDTAVDIATWVMREMQGEEGGYYSALDADSEGEEGRFYVWEPTAVRALLEEPEYAVFARRFGLDREANFEGRWHLHGFVDPRRIADELQLDTGTVEQLLERARQKLFSARRQRVPPGLDDKVLTSWNALMIRGMSIAGRVLARDDMIDSTGRALALLRRRLWQDGRLLATCNEDRAHLPAYLDDHAFLIDAIMEHLQARWDSAALTFAMALADTLLDRFEDRARGGFFFTAHDHEPLIQRPKPFGDDALPAGNGIAAQALARLGHLLGETRYLDAAERTLSAAWPAISQLPYAHNTLLDALEDHLKPPELVVLRGAAEALPAWQRRALRHYAPQRMVFAIPDTEGDLPGLLRDREATASVTAYLCTGTRCRAPITSLAALELALRPGELTPTDTPG